MKGSDEFASLPIDDEEVVKKQWVRDVTTNIMLQDINRIGLGGAKFFVKAAKELAEEIWEQTK